MKEGFYSIVYVGQGGDTGCAVLTLDTGIAVGADIGGGAYDGTFEFNPRTQMIDIDIIVTIPPGVQTVMGTPPLAEEAKFPVLASFPRETPEYPVRVDTPFGPIAVVIKFLRAFPD